MNTVTKPNGKHQVVLRRFEDLPKPSPDHVRALPNTHPAILAGQPLFADRVFPADTVDNIFISGVNNRKIGRVVTKGAWKGMPIYMLTLPERTTCPRDCHIYQACYGNAMHMAKRIAPGPALEARIQADLKFLANKHPAGFVVRLHVLGDFYSAAYVKHWERELNRYPNLHVYGYTARGNTKDCEIAKEIGRLKEKFGRRFAIRWSLPTAACDGAVVLNERPEQAKIDRNGVVCPAETEDTACCATCGLCWEQSFKDKTIYFLKHGMGSSERAGIVEAINGSANEGLRKVTPIERFARLATKPIGKPPRLLWVKPTDLFVETAYQRDLSQRSINHISSIVRKFDWGIFTPPSCVDIDGRFYVYDGQHSAIATASHPDIDLIPIMVIDEAALERRAGLFIGKNWGRVNPTKLQKFKAEITNGNAEAIQIRRIAEAASVRILAHPPSNGRFAIGDTIALGAITTVTRRYGGEVTERTLKLLYAARQAPIRADHIRAVCELLCTPEYRDTISEGQLTELIAGEDYDAVMLTARGTAKEHRIPLSSALAINYHQQLVRSVP